MRYFPMIILVSIAVVVGAIVIVPAQAGLAPSPSPFDPDRGIRIQNGDIGVVLWGPNNRPTFNVGKADVYDRRYYGYKEPVITLAQMKEWAATGDFPKKVYKAHSAYVFPVSKPVGQFIIGLPGIEAEWTVTGHRVGPGVLTLTAKRGEQRLDLRVYVHGARNLIVFEGDAYEGIDGLWFRLYRHRDTTVVGTDYWGKVSFEYDYSADEGNGPMDPPTSGHENDLGWVSQVFPAEPTFSDGFRYTFAAVTSMPGVRVESVEGRRGLGTPAHSPYEQGEETASYMWNKKHILVSHYRPINNAKGAATTFHLPRVEGQFQILATVATSTESTDTLALARSRLQEALPESPTERFAAHQAATQQPGYPFLTRKPGGYYGCVPLCSGTTQAYADLYQTQDMEAWHTAFKIEEWSAYSYFIGNRIEYLEPYFNLIEQLLPAAKNNAREVYDCPGAMFTMNHFAIRTDRAVHTTLVWEQIMEITAQACKPFWERYLYTGDEDFLRNRGYPVIREGARFYAAYVTLEEDMHYHVFPTVSPEHWRLTKNFLRNKDSQSALTFVKYQLNAAAQAAEILGVDEEERETWSHIAANMAPYPTYDTPDGPIFVDVRGAPPIRYNTAVPLTAIVWGEDITPESPPEVLAIARRTIEKIDVWKPHRSYIRWARRLLGEYPPDSRIDELNLLQSQGGWDMVKKRGGWIRVFPAVPDDYTGSFENYLAIGAFEVSAACKDGTVTELTISSRVGNTCQLINPWPGQAILVKEEEAAEPLRLQGDHVQFPTRAGATYQIEPTAL